MAEGEAVYRFPLVVEGNWDCSLSKTLKNKLLCFFQSPKRSGGGECKIHVDPGREEQITVYFAQEDVRQSVLNIKSHELSLPGMKTLKLTVSLPSAEGAPNKNVPLEEQDPSQIPVVAKESHQLGEQSFVNYSSQDVSDYAEKEAGRMAIQEGFSVVVTTDAGSEIQTDILELYFENKRHSGGGPIKSCLKDGQQFIIIFENEADAQEVLQRDRHQISKIVLHVKKYQQELKPDPSETSSSLVILENVPETMIECMLILLVETVSGLSEEDKDFDVEMMPECSAAILTFIKPIETDKFIKAFNQYHRVQQQKISARSLEMPKSILVENIPPVIPKDYIVIYFESKKHGGGLVLENRYIPEDNSAIITFQDSKVVATILERKHCLMNVPVSVYPYYKSLGAAVYGKERLQIKMPDPFPVSVDPYHWRFIQQNYCLLHEITREMAGHYCEIRWPSELSANPEIMVHPSHDLSKKKRSLVKTWKEDALTVLTQILSRQKVVKREMNSDLWEAIRNSLVKDDILIITDVSKREVVLVGAAGSVNDAEEEMKVLIENACRKMERERLTIEEAISITACKYAILCNCELQENICSAYPELKITYDASKEHITLRGLPAEVFKIKSDILERISSMVQKPIDIHSNILLFLQHVDNESLSRLLFWNQKINAYYELSEKSVLLSGGILQDLHRAEEELKKDLTFQSIELEDCTVTKKNEWLELTEQLYKAYNCSSETIIIQEQEGEIVIAGYFKEVATAHQKLSDFVDNHTYIQRNIKSKFAAVVMYVQQEKSPKWINLNRQGVKIHFGTLRSRKVISLEGPRVAVLKGVELFHNILSSLHSTSIIIDKPGAKSFFKEREELYINGARQRFNCLIRIQESKEEVEETGEDGNGYGEKQQLCYEVKLGNDIVVILQKADLTQCSADVIVNASNEELMHIGGLASRLLEAAGPELQKECKDQVRQYGPLKTGCATITNAGKLPCKQVIHAVGPRWCSAEKEKCIKLLKKSVRESLKLAARCQHRSIAIPAISSGIFGFPLKESTHSIVTAIKESLEDFSENSCLKQIYLMDIRDDTIRAFSETLNEVFGPSLSTTYPFPKTKHSTTTYPFPKTKHSTAKIQADPETVMTAEGLKILLKKKGIEEATTGVIVNSVARDLQLDKGPLSRALLAKAGAELQVELTQEGQGKDIKEGCVLKTSGYALSCCHVLHAVLPAWNRKKKLENKNLGGIIEECLKVTEQLSLSSITFPAIGTGNLGYPKQYVAKLFFDEVFKFSQTENPKSLKEVHFVLHASDTTTVQAFMEELKSRLSVSQTSASVPKASSENFQQGSQAFSEQSSTLKYGNLKTQIGSLELQLEQGDITKQMTDAIVNITNQTFNLQTGVSKAIMESAGPEVVKECADLASQPHNNLICTQGGNLSCKNIIHLVNSNDIKKQVSQTLMECEQRQFTSVAFPAIGTGYAKRDPVIAADSMIDAIVDYASTTSVPWVREIKIIIFQSHLLEVFYASTQRTEVTASKPSGGTRTQKSFFSKVAEFFTTKKPAVELKPALVFERTVEPAVFQICGDHQNNVENAAAWIKKLIFESQNEYTISDEWISNFGESEYKKLENLQETLHIALKLDNEASPPSLCICGIAKDVLQASREIQTMIRRIREDREEKSKADLLTNLVLWRYEDNGQYRSFDSLTNMQLEAAAQHQRLYELTINKKRYKVDPSKMQAVDDQGTRITLRRVAKVEDNPATAIPEEWDAMEETMRVKVVELKPGMKEYKKVHDMFNQTSKGYTIKKIERIQNPFYWQAYQIKKQEMDAKNGKVNNEMLLFHGTASTSLTHINSTGFNRSYAGLHAACFGNGTYFAVNASYSAHSTYSQPDASGTKYMYLARVLVGEYCVGSKGLVVPYQKSGTDPTDLYDSVTDHLSTPSLFVIFNDIQAYPEYLITFNQSLLP
ncbi:protein mono-ADP-ribosyltransferase PARP14 [Protobothrops mucrosquamatus]|uniref:protein mono-ADP-ribosyltransferase PARP14 n=1 Tax=Protobothrops mucrosquamatus TaxID=103944 RepID=UPI000775DFEE|nr:protein mono-ADP-ribosyltransferase PARP14 [Protobothrops mucrosquamatus]